MPFMNIFPKLDPETIALLLDVDGTLIDIKPSPGEVHVSAELRDLVAVLSRQTGGALALVSGRPITDLDRLFAPLDLPAIGGHGAEMRVRTGEVSLGARPCRRICASIWRALQSRAWWSRTRAIHSRCITATRPKTSDSCAGLDR